MGYNPKQEEAYVRYQRVAETQASNYFSDQEIDAAHIPPPWMIQRIEQLRREQGRRNERDRNWRGGG